MRTSNGGQPTIVSIAARAGVSIASVSRVLNGQPARPDTVARVRRAADELGYVPNAVARSLKGGRTRQLTFAMPDIGNPVYVAMVRAIQAVTKAAGYRLLLHSTDAVAEDELAVLRSLGDRTSDGLIICPIRITEAHIEALTNAAGPVVVIGSLPAGVPVDSVRADSIAGAAMAVRHLFAGGRRRIALINGPPDTVPGHNRERGYRLALTGCGLSYDERLVVHTEFGIGPGTAAARRLLETAAPFDAVFCANDQLALGAAHALLAAGLRIPQDVAVAGMDDSALAQAGWPPLTSVDLGSSERGRLAAEMLLDRLEAADAGADDVDDAGNVRSSNGGRGGSGSAGRGRAGGRATDHLRGDDPGPDDGAHDSAGHRPGDDVTDRVTDAERDADPDPDTDPGGAPGGSPGRQDGGGRDGVGPAGGDRSGAAGSGPSRRPDVPTASPVDAGRRPRPRPGRPQPPVGTARTTTAPPRLVVRASTAPATTPPRPPETRFA
ncbi:LacI family DNA-binding transcriptional regulator [Streptomyces sp. B6B3]|uniref:LacI family DNA-binding transcriptional regulator n=1 Tax=Streptomyces sp. B6B3 TaxID=3153570 RepID=UPI00325E31F8